MAECIGRHHLRLLEPLLGGMAGLRGAQRTPGRVSRGRKAPRTTSIDYSDLDAVKRANARDARILLMTRQLQGIELDL